MLVWYDAFVAQRKHYPLEALIELRQAQLQESMEALREQIATEEAARLRLRDAHNAQRQHLDQVHNELQKERHIAECGAIRAEDGVRLHFWHTAQKNMQSELQNKTILAHRELQQATEQLSVAQENLAQAHGSIKLVQLHRARFDKEREQQQERCAENECDDIYNARRWSEGRGI